MNADPPLDDDHAFSWRRAPVQLADRLGVRPAGLLGAVVAVLAAGLGGWWALRPPPPPVEDTLPQAAAMSTAPPPPPSVPGVLVVHVDGAVAQPGVHEVVAGARVIDAVQAAGGLGPSADRTRINLAQPLSKVDGCERFGELFDESCLECQNDQFSGSHGLILDGCHPAFGHAEYLGLKNGHEFHCHQPTDQSA